MAERIQRSSSPTSKNQGAEGVLGFLGRDMAVDLGTANTLVYVRGRGVVLNEPSVVAINTLTGAILAVGAEAKRMIGRTPSHIQAVRPLKDGVIADFDVTEKMLRYFIQKVHKRRLLAKPRVVVCVPSGITGVEQRAVEEATIAAGCRRAYIIEEPMAAAIGAGLPIHEPTGNMVVDIGGGTTEVAVISLGGIVTSTSIRIGGDELDEAIIQHVKKEYSLLLGERTSEAIKLAIASVFPMPEELVAEIKGRDLVSGLPKTITISAEEIRRAIEEPVNAIIDAIKTTLDRTPPELSADIMDRGIVLTGGGALAPRPRQAPAARDRHARAHRRRAAAGGGAGLRQVPRGVRGAAAGPGDPVAAVAACGPSGSAPARTRLLVVALVSISLAVITLDYRQGVTGPARRRRRRREGVHGPHAGGCDDRDRADRRLLLGARAPAVARRRQRTPARGEQRAATRSSRSDAYQAVAVSRVCSTCSSCARHSILPWSPPPSSATASRTSSTPSRSTGAPATASRKSSRWRPAAPTRRCSSVASLRSRPCRPTWCCIIDRDLAVAATIGDTEEAGLIEGQGDQRPAHDLRRARHAHRGRRVGVHAGLRARRTAGSLPSRHADRAGLAARPSQRTRHSSSSRSGPRSISRPCSSCSCCRPGSEA